MTFSAFQAGRDYARHHVTRPMLGALTRGRGWTEREAKFFLAGFDAAKLARAAWD